MTGGRLCDQSFLFLGAGEAGLGIGDLIVTALIAERIPETDARLLAGVEVGKRSWWLAITP